jgi:PAS domain S-box-containing protein
LNPFRLYDESFQGFLTLVVGQIAAAIANAQAYTDTRKRAEALAEIDRAKTAFFSNASHEFRTPLTLMMSPLEEMLVRNATSDHIVAAKHEVELIYRNGLRLLKLVNTLLDFSRIEAGRMQAVYEPVDISVCTAEIASSFRSALEKAELDFIVDCPPLSVPAYVDRDMWEKIVLNLLSNAFKYTFKGEVAVVLRLSTDGKMLELTVRDTGVGVPKEELPRLFERFHRVEGQRGRSLEGTGIGLALVQELTRLHGGTVRAESALGRGTSFIVAIPVGSSHLPLDRLGGQRTAPSTAVQAEAFIEEALRWLPGTNDRTQIAEREVIGPRREALSLADRPLILVADDNTDMLAYVTRLLSSRYEVEAVHDGLAAWEAARRRRPDLILSDIMMPRLDGVGLLRALRSDPSLCEVPVVLLSARAGEDARVEGLEAGADDYVVKPFNARELLARIAANLETARIRREAANELRKLNEELEQRVELRAQQIEQTFARLHESEHRFRLLVEGVSDYAIYMLDSAGLVTNWNTGAERIKGYAAAEIIGQHFSRFYTEEDRLNGLPDSALRTANRTGKFAAEGWRVRKNGSTFWASVLIEPLREDHGRPAGFAKITRDLTERRAAEEQLRQAQKMEAIGQLTGGIAHDFNNMLQVIIGNLDILHRRAARHDAREGGGDRRFLDAALGGAQRAAKLTQRLLAFARRQPLAPESIDVNKLVASMSDLLHHTFGETIKIGTVLAGGMWRISVDANQLESALLNIAVNARDAMPDVARSQSRLRTPFLTNATSRPTRRLTPANMC